MEQTPNLSGKLDRIPTNARVFTSDFRKSDVERIVDEMYDSHFDSLHDLAKWYRGGTIGITESAARDESMRPGKEQVRHDDEARRIFRALIDEGFFQLSRDPDPGYDYTDQFFDFMKLMRFVGIGELDESTSENARFLLRPRDA